MHLNKLLNEAGYDWKNGMSNNAVSAYANGEKPLSKWGKTEMLQKFESGIDDLSDYVKDLYKEILADVPSLMKKLKKLSVKDLRELLLYKNSYHHTSKYFNTTDFYILDTELALDSISQDGEDYGLNETYVDNATITQVLNQKELINHIGKYKYEYRIIYDANKDWYLIGTAFDNIHEQILYNCSAYYGLDFNGMVEYYNEHYADLFDLLYSPKESGLSVGFDHNDKLYTFKGFGSIYTKGPDLPKVLLDDLTERFGKPVYKEKLKENTNVLEKETLPELNNNFWHWFGDSVVKDEAGNPLICFHGSTLDIDEFDIGYSGYNTGNNEEHVFYFTTDRDTALSYSQEAVIRSKEVAYYDKEEGIEYETWEEFEDYLRTEVCKTPHINPCFICIEKPYIYDAKFRDFDPKLNYTLMSMIKGEIDTSHYLFDAELYYEIAEEHEQYDEETDEYIQIKDFDYDGIIILNVRDSISPLVDNYVDEYIVWHPNQIKSIYNKGNWSWNSHNVFETLNKKLEQYL